MLFRQINQQRQNTHPGHKTTAPKKHNKTRLVATKTPPTKAAENAPRGGTAAPTENAGTALDYASATSGMQI